MRLFTPLPELGSRWNRLLRAIHIAFAIAFPPTVVVGAFVHQTIMLGPGLVAERESSWSLLQAQLLGRSPAFIAVFAVLAAFVLVWNGVMIYRGFRPDDRGALSPREGITFILANAVLTALLYGSLAVIGLGAFAIGRGFEAGFDIIGAATDWCTNLVARVPVLVQLPYPLPLIAGILLVSLFHYWFHRLGHTWRPFWLLWHRPHHMTTHLTIPTTQPVFAAFPLFILLSVPFQLGVGVAAKLFHSESMIAEALLLRVVGQIVAVGSHNSALYGAFWKTRWLRTLSAFYGEGPYHYMHHSALPQHRLVNLSESACMLWDRVFGTYVAPTDARPPVGLTGSPRLHSNPLRIALAGFMQIAYELKVNPGWGTRWRILFAGSDYEPPMTRDFALDTEGS